MRCIIRIRHYSTGARRTPRLPISQLGNVFIPGPEEMHANAAAKMPPAAVDNLAAQLMRLSQDTPTEKVTPEAEVTQRVQIPRQPRPSPPTREQIQALTLKRREERLLRQPRSPPTEEQVEVLTRKRRLLRLERENSDQVHISDEFRPPPRFTTPPRDGAVRSHQMRRGAVQREDAFPLRSPKPGNQRTLERKRSGVPIARKTSTSSPVEEIDESIFQPGGHEPEFTGPEPPSPYPLDLFGPSFGTKDPTVITRSGTTVRIPLPRMNSFYDGNYSRYVNTSKEYACPPDVLGPVKVAERTLSHQRHYNLTARNRTLELVVQATQPVAKVPIRT